MTTTPGDKGTAAALPADDLSTVLRDLRKRATPEKTALLANSKDVRAFLEAGVRLLVETIRSDDATKDKLKLMFRGLGKAGVEPLATQRLGLKQPRNNWRFEQFWSHQSDYHSDLIRYILRPSWYREMVEDIGRRLSRGDLSDLTFGEMASRVAEEQQKLTQTNDFVALTYMLSTALPEHPLVRELTAERYQIAVQLWADLYKQMGERYGFQLRDGYQYEDLAIFLNTLIDGVIVRRLASHELTYFSNGQPIMLATLRHALLLMVDRPIEDLLAARPLTGH